MGCDRPTNPPPPHSPPRPGHLPSYGEHCATQLADTHLAPASAPKTTSQHSPSSRRRERSPFACPPGWTRHIDPESCDAYYVHAARQRVSWTHPGLCLAVYNLVLEDLPPVWDVGIDTRGLYFVNHATQHTQRRIPAVLHSLSDESSTDSDHGDTHSLTSSLSDALDSLSGSASSMAGAVTHAIRSFGSRLWLPRLPSSPELPRHTTAPGWDRCEEEDASQMAPHSPYGAQTDSVLLHAVTVVSPVPERTFAV